MSVNTGNIRTTKLASEAADNLVARINKIRVKKNLPELSKSKLVHWLIFNCNIEEAAKNA